LRNVTRSDSAKTDSDYLTEWEVYNEEIGNAAVVVVDDSPRTASAKCWAQVAIGV
jgi:hypothetical protein